MAVRSGPSIFSMKRRRKSETGMGGAEGWSSHMGRGGGGGGERDGGMETGEEAGPERLASNYINSV